MNRKAGCWPEADWRNRLYRIIEKLGGGGMGMVYKVEFYRRSPEKK